MTTQLGADLILEALDEATDAGATADQLAELVGRHPGNCRRILAGLRDAGLVRQTMDGRHAVWTRTGRPVPPPVPRIKAPRKRYPGWKKVVVREADHAALSERAAQEGRSRAAITAEALRRYYEQQGPPLAS